VDFEQISIAELATSPGSGLDRKRVTDRIRAALSRIPAEPQLLLELHYWHDLDANDLGEIVEASPGAIRVRLLRARRLLRDELRRSEAEALLGRLLPDDADPRA
jgi:RNA polymerase sigma factor (sigma-70 family)